MTELDKRFLALLKVFSLPYVWFSLQPSYLFKPQELGGPHHYSYSTGRVETGFSRIETKMNFIQ